MSKILLNINLEFEFNNIIVKRELLFLNFINYKECVKLNINIIVYIIFIYKILNNYIRTSLEMIR